MKAETKNWVGVWIHGKLKKIGLFFCKRGFHSFVLDVKDNGQSKVFHGMAICESCGTKKGPWQ